MRIAELLLVQLSIPSDENSSPNILYCVYHAPRGLETLARNLRNNAGAFALAPPEVPADG